MPQVDRLALAFQTRALAAPADGDVLVLRAVPSAFLDLVPRRPAALRAELPPAARRAGRARPRGLAPAPRGRRRWWWSTSPAAAPRTSATSPAASTLLPPGGTLVVAGAKSDGVDSLARQVARQIPLDGAFVKAHGRVFWLTRPDGAAGRGRGLGARRRAAAERRGLSHRPGHVLARARRPGQPAARRRARRPARRPGRRPRRRLGLARPRRAGRGARHHRARPLRGRGAWRSTPPAPTSPTRAPASTGPTPPASAPACRPTTR